MKAHAFGDLNELNLVHGDLNPENVLLTSNLSVYISDIATTVSFWEAMTILVVEQKEKRAYLKNLKSRFSSIRFVDKNGEK